MEKIGEVRTGLTPCCVCGKPGEAIFEGNSYCFSDFMKAKYKEGPHVPAGAAAVKLASAHVKEAE